MAEIVWKGKHQRSLASRAVLRTNETHGRGAEPNRLILGHAPELLRALNKKLFQQVALVYIDPPFDTGQRFDFLASVPGAAAGAPRVAVEAYRDDRGLDAWLSWFFEIAVGLRDLLVPGGSLYVHLDAHVAHYAKVLLDEVFGRESFQREIIWRIGWVSGFKSRARAWIRNHDTLLFYAKGGRPRVFHKEYVPYPPGYVRRDGAAPRGPGYPIEDVWNASPFDRLDSIQIVSFSGEKVGYPTQKNEALIARIVRASSSPGDLVFDSFVGSGTTAVVAEKLGRRWLGSDSSPLSIHATRKRLLALPDVRPFVVQGVESPSRSGASPRRQRLSARGQVTGRRVTIELDAFRLSKQLSSKLAQAGVAHWSQWVDAWCVDWDHQNDALNVGVYVDRRRPGGDLALSAAHTYAKPGNYLALVKVFDILGGEATATVAVVVK